MSRLVSCMDRFDAPNWKETMSRNLLLMPQDSKILQCQRWTRSDIIYAAESFSLALGCRISPPTLSATPRFRACGGALKAGPANQQRLGVRYWHDVLGSAVTVTGVRRLTFGKTRIRKPMSPMRKVCVIHDGTSREETSLSLTRNII